MKTPEQVKAVVDAVTKEFVDKGLLIEAGYRAMAILMLENAPPLQRAEMRKAYFLGAQHLWSSIFSVLEKGDDATPNDLKRFDLINEELRAFIATMENQ